ncbi:MAG: hypothetical protein GF344_12990, partial [Chitinivibrionales bacterium]|nr:hypothetical protein [Chitinivibrionales bacterium]MBD3357650.1 hypothetical protein [Chitinivibrionales bacterium]
MPIHLHFSNRTEDLFLVFAEEFERAWTDPLEPPPLVVPNNNLAKWLKVQFALRNGAVANLNVRFLEELLWGVLSASIPDTTFTTQRVGLLDSELLEQLLFHVLSDSTVLVPEGPLLPLYNYLHLGNGEVSAPRKVRLCGQLAGLFLEYEYNRPATPLTPGLLDCWPDADFFTSDRSADHAMELWQRTLYGMVFAPGGARDRLADACGILQLTLPQLHHRLRTDSIRLAPLPSGRLFCFGTANLSLFHRRLLHQIARTADVFVYLLNPCAAFWEDVRTTRKPGLGRRTARPSLEQQQSLRFKPEEYSEEHAPPTADENTLLELWGHIGKESIRLWCQSTDYDFAFEEVPCGPEEYMSVLHRVQDMVLARTDDAGPDRLPQDASIQVFDCPSIIREVETIRDSVLHNLENTPDLSLSDIMVLLPDIDQYRGAIHQVFGAYHQGDEGWVPYAIADESAGTSHFAKAVELLLCLSDGLFSRHEVFSFFRNPLVMHGLGVDRNTIDTWERWADNLNIYHGFDREHRSRTEHNPAELHTWRHGLRRLLIGRIAEDRVYLGLSTDPAEAVVPYRETSTEDDETLGAFCTAVESLFADVDHLAHESWNSPAETAAYLCDMIGRWIAIAPEHSEEEEVRVRYLARLTRLQCHENPGSPPIKHTDFRALARALLSVKVPGKGTYLTEGLTIATLRPSCPIPSRLTYIAGLSEGAFPGREIRDTLDLRNTKRQIGDINPMQLNQVTFLETLVSTRDRLYLSFVGYDCRKDEPLQPCGTILELESFLQNHVLPHNTRFLRRQVALVAETAIVSEADGHPCCDPCDTFSLEAARLRGIRAAKSQSGFVRPHRLTWGTNEQTTSSGNS